MQTANFIIQAAAITCLSLALLLTLIACWRHKSVLVKLVALEVLVNLMICGIAVWALRIHFGMLLDICLALSLIMFLSTAAYCQFLLREK